MIGSEPADVLAAYRERLRDIPSVPGGGAGAPVDELVHTSVSTAGAALAGAIGTLGSVGLRSREAVVRRFVEDDGVTYGTTSGHLRGRRWQLDPLPVVMAGGEWAALSAGLVQRAELLDRILADIYGERRLIQDGIVPGEVVFGHAGFVPQTDGTLAGDGHHLVLPSTDLARMSDGSWTVIGDRAQAPSGAGYAMADRRLIARALPRLYRTCALARLRVFFDEVGMTLADLGAPEDGLGRVVLLSPGPGSETAFDQAFTASLLGIPLVQAEDLVSHDGRIWLRGTGREERVDVMLRRVDAEWSDPLELRSDSQLGVPGLIEAVRSGAVRVVNPLGAGVLENPGLLPYLPAACRALLGEELRLPGPRTWWCGDRASAREAVERIGDLVIKPLSAGPEHVTRFGWQLSAPELREARAQIDAQPWAWALQEPVAMSTVPVVSGAALVPRRFVLRTFGVSVQGEYRFMPGGLGRVSDDAGSQLVSSSLGARAKDVWVESSATVAPAAVRALRPISMAPGHAAVGRGLAPRVADDLFWLGRYAERAESLSRLLLVVDELLGDYLGRPESPGSVVMRAMVQAAAGTTGRRAPEDFDPTAVTRMLRQLVLEEGTPGTLAFAVAHLVQDAQAARDLLSVDTWMVLSRLERAFEPGDDPDAPLQPALDQVLESLLALSGLGAENMVHDPTWAFLDAGRRVERTLQTVALLRRTICEERSPIIDGQVTEAVLRVGDSLITHHRRLAAGQGPASPVRSALDLLLLDVANPRSVAYQLDLLSAALGRVPGEPLTTAVERVQDRLLPSDLDHLCADGRAGLRALLADVDEQVRGIATLVARTHFVRPAPHRSMYGGDLTVGGGAR
ncbi:circularly permuted type 2 ATP-grasp protein [Leekyejoonella antrihumi]|uniref:Uncharacterized protein n=1 Tax=Leekyejoonella antrihumi TaxID=1660198 RepID=A0A563E4Q3_9MICO|nr:circularly permuted type 2 ATP-grasp protein [Leekyejoonella antrihumi]TWP37223.1 hypothetical protein FGL98_07395 [Leekyejoonella antrihumi]